MLLAALACLTLSPSAEASSRAGKPTGLRVTEAGQRSIAIAWQSPRPRGPYGYRLYLKGHAVASTRDTSATLHDLACGRLYVVGVEARRRGKKSRKARSRARRSKVRAATAPCKPIDLAARCNGQNCDDAFASMEPGGHYHLRAGLWRVTRPVHVPSRVTLTGDGTGITGTDLVYSGPPTSGAVVVAGTRGRDWVGGHIAGFEIETDQLHQLRLKNDTAYATVPITQAAIGLEVINPTASSSVSNVNLWKFQRNSVRIDNGARAPGRGVFQFSNFFVGTSPRPIEVRGSNARLLVRFGGIDLGPLSELAMLFAGDQTGATSVVESVKIEGDYDVPGYVVEGSAPVVFVGSTRYFNQSLYVDDPINGAPAFINRPPFGDNADALQCLGCTALGVQTALAVPGISQEVPTDKFGINLHRLTPAGARSVSRALATPNTPLVRPHDVVDLSAQCVERNCDAALANLKFAGRYHLPAGEWHFTRPFKVPETATFFGDGPQPASQGGTTLRYTGPSLPGDAAVRFGVGNGDMSGRMFSLRIDTQEPLTGGWGVRARDATNAATIEDIAVAGFPEGQMILDPTPLHAGSGPNFVRLADFTLSGGVHPLRVEEGRQTVLVQRGRINVDATSEEGMSLSGGEQLAATRVVESVTVAGDHDVPGFRVRSPAVTTFVRSSRTAAPGRVSAPGFLYTALVPRRVTECLGCTVSGLKTAFSMPQLGVDVPGTDGERFSHLNPNIDLRTTREPFNVELPTVTGTARVGGTLDSGRGRWTADPTSYSHQWIRCKPPHIASNPATRCVAIAGATQPAYAVTAEDAGFHLRLSVTARNSFGGREATSLALLASG